MRLTDEEKKRRKEQRRIDLWSSSHKLIDGVDHKKCKICEKYYPSTDDYFYILSNNKIDGLSSGCILCTRVKYKKGIMKSKGYVKGSRIGKIGNTSLSHEYVKGFFEENNCTLIDTYVTSSKPIKYICNNKHLVEKISFNNFQRAIKTGNNGCKICQNDKLSRLKRHDFNKVIELFAQAGNKIISTKSDYKNNLSPLRFICINGHEEETTLSSFTYCIGTEFNGCFKCSREVISSARRHPFEKIKEEFAKKKNTLISIPKDYKNLYSPLTFICEYGHLDTTSYASFKNAIRNACNICNESSGEKIIDDYLNENNLYFTREEMFDGLIGLGGGQLRYDFAIYDPVNQKLTALIEYDGIFHFEKVYEGDNFETTQIHDEIKNKYCYDNGIVLIRIPYWEKENLREILNKKLKNVGVKNVQTEVRGIRFLVQQNQIRNTIHSR